MPSIAEQVASIISEMLSPSAVQLIADSPGGMGDLFYEFLQALIGSWKKKVPRHPLRNLLSFPRKYLPAILYAGAILFLVITAIFSLSSSSWGDRWSWAWKLALWTYLTAFFVSSLPLVSRVVLRNLFSRIVLTILEFLCLGVVLVLFARFQLRLPIWHVWALYTAGLIALVTAGGFWVKLVRARTARKLLEEWNQSVSPNNGPARGTISTQLDRMKVDSYWGLLVYSALPLGIPIGLFFGFRSGHTPYDVVSVSLRWMFGLALIFVSYFLIASCRRMTAPTLGLLPSTDLESGTEGACDWGCVMTEYRKIFLADSIESTALLIAFSLLAWLLYRPGSLSGLDLRLIAIVVVISITLNEFPYLVGQWRVHEKLVSRYHGWEKVKKLKEANEVLPLVPKFEFIAAFVGEASAGGLALEIVKKLTELTAKP